MLRPYWTLAYCRHRLQNALYRFTHPGRPWLTPASIAFLDKWLARNYVGLEWGAGRSTLWFARRVNRLTSIEHDPVWFEQVARSLKKADSGNVDLRLCEADPEKYAGVASGFEDGSLDFALVDGASALRDICTLAAIPKVREGGLLIVDDAQRYLPLAVAVPDAIEPHAEPLSLLWKEAAEMLGSWKRQVTCDGMRATVIWRRPVTGSNAKTGMPVS